MKLNFNYKGKKGAEALGLTEKRGQDLRIIASEVVASMAHILTTNKIEMIAACIDKADPATLEELVYITYCVSHKLGEMAAVEKGYVKLVTIEKEEIK